MKADNISRIVNKHNGIRGGIISMLEDIQKEYGYLPSEALQKVSKSTDVSLVELYGIATFYKAFSLNPRGKHLISLCMGTACHVRTAPIILEEFERQLGISAGETTPDEKFTLETVNCLGACALGPIVVVDGHYFSKVTTNKVKKIINKANAGLDEVEIKKDKSVFPIHLRCPRCNHTLMDTSYLIDDYPSVRLTGSFDSKHGWVRLSSLYGSHNVDAEYEIPIYSVLHIFCPHCHAELVGATNCSVCNASMVPMIIAGGGMMQICSRHGCKNHQLDVNGVNF